MRAALVGKLGPCRTLKFIGRHLQFFSLYEGTMAQLGGVNYEICIVIQTPECRIGHSGNDLFFSGPFLSGLETLIIVFTVEQAK